MARILIVEDDPQMQQGLRDNLDFEGYETDSASDGRQALEKILNEQYDLIILDVMLPELSGFDVCRQARQEGVGTPIIMLTARGTEIDRVLGLEMGADDYVTKPFGLRELLARVRAVLRRTEIHSSEKSNLVPVTIGRLEIHFYSYNAYENGNPQAMTHKEFDILKLLWEHRNETVSRDLLLDQIWGEDTHVTTRTVDNFILKLRRRIEEDPAVPRHILTVHGIGYKLIP